MTSLLAQARLQRGAVRLIPLASGILALLLDLLPLSAPSPASIAPALLLIVAYYWTLHRPDLLTSLDLFMLGLLHDLAGGAPLGVTSIVLLTARRMVLTPQRPVIARPFLSAWLGFGATALTTELLRWILAMLVHDSLFAIGPTLVQAIITAAVYPPAAALLTLVGSALGEEPDARPG